MRTRIINIIFLTFTFVELFAQESNNRYALLIGINDYPNNNTLVTPWNDIDDIEVILRDFGYDVTHKYNPSYDEMATAIFEFTEKLSSKKSSEGFFWFAGHGIQFENKNYLIPQDAIIKTPDDLKEKTYSFNRLLGLLGDASNITNIVVLDACRNYTLPFSGRQYASGLSDIDETIIPESTFVIYSTGSTKIAYDFADPGKTNGRNSAFAQAFIAKVGNNEPFLDIMAEVTDETMRITNNYQKPKISMQLAKKDYYLKPQLSRIEPILEKGTILITLNDQGAIFINGKCYNVDNEIRQISIDLPVGQYKIVAQWKLDESQSEKTVIISQNSRQSISFNWERKFNLSGVNKMGIDFGILPLPDTMKFYIGMPYIDKYELGILPNSFSAHLLMSFNFDMDNFSGLK